MFLFSSPCCLEPTPCLKCRFALSLDPFPPSILSYIQEKFHLLPTRLLLFLKFGNQVFSLPPLPCFLNFLGSGKKRWEGERERERAVLLLLMQSALLTFFPWSREKGERERFHLVPLFLSLSLFLFFSGLREELEKGGGLNFRSASGGGRAGKKFSSSAVRSTNPNTTRPWE